MVAAATVVVATVVAGAVHIEQVNRVKCAWPWTPIGIDSHRVHSLASVLDRAHCESPAVILWLAPESYKLGPCHDARVRSGSDASVVWDSEAIKSVCKVLF